MRRVAVFGGAFDPPTFAHLKQLELVLDHKDPLQSREGGKPFFDEVRVVPCGNGRGDKWVGTPAPVRLELLKLALEDMIPQHNGRLIVDDIEVREGEFMPCWRLVDALARPDTELHFVIGEDQSCNLQNWQRGEWVRENCRFFVLPRRGFQVAENALCVKHFIRGPTSACSHLSSSQCRESTTTVAQLREACPGPVVDYILANNLYRRYSP